MQIHFNRPHRFEISDALRQYTTSKIDRMIKRHKQNKITRVNVSLDIENLLNVAEATVHVTGADLHARSTSQENMYSAIDLLLEKVERQLVKYKEMYEERRKDH